MTHAAQKASGYDQLIRRYSGEIQQNVSLKPHCSFGVGGTADLFAEISVPAQLGEILALSHALEIPLAVIGDGTNLLVSDRGFRGLIIRNSIMGLEVSGRRIKIASGEEYMRLVNAATEAGLTGMEFAAGIWGTVGGAVYGNAGAYGSEICDVLVEVELAEAGGAIRTEPTEYFEFTYRSSKLKKTKEIVVSATVELQPGDRKTIQSRVDEILAIRAEKHPRIPNSAGSFFKNIVDPTQPYGKLPAGKLLDEVGAKSLCVGGARVYEKHANILINGGGATSDDIHALAEELKAKALEKHGVRLEEEVVFLGEFD